MNTKQTYPKKSASLFTLMWLVIAASMFAIGSVVNTNTDSYLPSLIIIITSVFVLLVVAICNILIRYIKNKAHENFETYYEKLYEDKEEIRKNKLQYLKKYQKIKRFAYIYVIFLFVAFFTLTIGLIVLMFKVHIAFIVLVLFLIIYQIYISSKMLLVSFESENNSKIDLNEYKKLKEMLQKALQIADLKIYDQVDVLVFLDCNFAVSKISNRYKLIFGLKALQAMNESEIVAILLHEFAHIINKDVQLSERVNKDATKWIRTREAFTSKLFFRLVGFYILRDGYKYTHAVSLEKEEHADEFVAQNGYSQSFNSAIFKLFMLNVHGSYPFGENFFEKYEVMPSNILDESFKSFLRIYEIKKDQWRKYISSEIEYENRTHPILSQRIKMQDLNDINIDFTNIEEELKQDVDKLLNKVTLMWFNAKAWENDRLFEYVYIKEAIEEYEKNPDNKQIPLFNLAVGYFSVRKLEKALNMFEMIIKARSNFAAAYYYKGLIQLEQENLEGLKTLELAVEYNYDFFAPVSSEIMNYCVFHGLKSEYEYYTKWFKSKMNLHMDIEIYRQKKKCRYVKTSVTDGIKKILKEQLFRLNVKRCYIADYKFTDDYKKTCVFFKASSYKETKEKYYEYLIINDAIQRIIPNARTFNSVISKVTNIKSAKILNVGHGNTDSSTAASNPGNILLSEKKWNKIVNDLYSVSKNRVKYYKTSVQGHLAHGDSQPAVVISAAPLLVAAYSEDMDAVIICKFPEYFKQTYDLKIGSKLICINTYGRGNTISLSIHPGPKYLGVWTDFYPLIADFLSEDVEYIKKKKQTIEEEKWAHVKALGDEYVRKFSKGHFRTGFWFCEFEKKDQNSNDI